MKMLHIHDKFVITDDNMEWIVQLAQEGPSVEGQPPTFRPDPGGGGGGRIVYLWRGTKNKTEHVRGRQGMVPVR